MALDPSASPELANASMLPSTDMATAAEWLRSLPPLASSDLAETHNRLLAAIHGITSSHHLPRTLIHNDAHPGNAVVTADGDAVFIDWGGSGLGSPMIDLGFLIVSSEIAISWSTPILAGVGRVEAIVDGYAEYRIPTPEEMEWLPDAIRFRGLLYGAAHLAATVSRGFNRVTETWWWARHEAAEEISSSGAEAIRAVHLSNVRELPRYWILAAYNRGVTRGWVEFTQDGRATLHVLPHLWNPALWQLIAGGGAHKHRSSRVPG